MKELFEYLPVGVLSGRRVHVHSSNPCLREELFEFFLDLLCAGALQFEISRMAFGALLGLVNSMVTIVTSK